MKITSMAAQLGKAFGSVPAIAGVAAILAFAPAAHAVVVVSAASNVAVPLTTQGVYINVVSGISNIAPASAPGWDINPWGSTTSTSALNFFNPTTPTGGVYVASIAGQVANLAVGTVVGAATPLFGSGQATTTAASSPWVLNATNYFGFRFIGDDTLLHYGYGTMIIGSSLQIRTVGNIWYEDAANTAITVAAVPEPATWALMLGGMAAAGAIVRRRRQSQA
jgi:hypothetical protein